MAFLAPGEVADGMHLQHEAEVKAGRPERPAIDAPNGPPRSSERSRWLWCQASQYCARHRHLFSPVLGIRLQVVDLARLDGKVKGCKKPRFEAFLGAFRVRTWRRGPLPAVFHGPRLRLREHARVSGIRDREGHLLGQGEARIPGQSSKIEAFPPAFRWNSLEFRAENEGQRAENGAPAQDHRGLQLELLSPGGQEDLLPTVMHVREQDVALDQEPAILATCFPSVFYSKTGPKASKRPPRRRFLLVQGPSQGLGATLLVREVEWQRHRACSSPYTPALRPRNSS